MVQHCKRLAPEPGNWHWGFHLKFYIVWFVTYLHPSSYFGDLQPQFCVQGKFSLFQVQISMYVNVSKQL